MTTLKPFDKALFEANDKRGRDIVKTFFTTLEIQATDNPDAYAVDLILSREGKKIGYAEVEIRHNWKTEEFPYDTLNVPSRKKKLLENDLPTYFFSINSIGNRMFVATDEVVLTSPLQENKNKYVREGEMFYKVALDRCKLVVI
jgi:hypothetical protein